MTPSGSLLLVTEYSACRGFSTRSSSRFVGDSDKGNGTFTGPIIAIIGVNSGFARLFFAPKLSGQPLCAPRALRGAVGASPPSPSSTAGTGSSLLTTSPANRRSATPTRLVCEGERSRDLSPTNCLRRRVRPRSSLTARSGIKLGRIMPWRSTCASRATSPPSGGTAAIDSRRRRSSGPERSSRAVR